MTRLLYHIVDEMRRIGYPVSWLGGDRQRYNVFGWELASPEYELIFSRRSLGWKNVEPVEVEEVFPEEALATIRRFQSAPACHAVRPNLEDLIQKANTRFWIAADGYAILSGQGRDHIRILELVSTSGDEVGMIRAMLDFNFGDRATWSLSAWDRARLGRLMPYVGYWRSGHSDMYRVNDLTRLLTEAQGAIAKRALAVRDFAVAIGVEEHDRTTVTTLSVTDGAVSIRAGKHADTYVELSPVETARLFLGGPPIAGEVALPTPLMALLPVPVYVFPFDHV
jgi:hypothetical protein